MKRFLPGVVAYGMWQLLERLEPRRFRSAGDLDATFGVAGRADVGGEYHNDTFPQADFQSIFAQPDGSILVWRSDVNVDRFNADGSLAAHVQFSPAGRPRCQAVGRASRRWRMENSWSSA
jgi:hypothetical protein